MHTHIPWKHLGYNIEPEKDQLEGKKKGKIIKNGGEVKCKHTIIYVHENVIKKHSFVCLLNKLVKNNKHKNFFFK